MKLRTALCHDRVDGQDAPLEASKNLIVDPRAQESALRSVPALDQTRAKFNLKNRDDRHEEIRRGNCIGPSDDIAIAFIRSPEFGYDIGIQ